MLKQPCAEHQAQSVKGAVPRGQSNQHICTKLTAGESKFSFLFAHDTTSRNNTNEDFAKKHKILLAD